MVNAIRFNESALLRAQMMAARGSMQGKLIQSLGSNSGLANASEALLANVSSKTFADALVASDAIQSRLQAVGGLELAARLGPQLIDQNVVAGLASGSRGLSLRDQANLVAVGLKSLRGSTVNFLA